MATSSWIRILVIHPVSGEAWRLPGHANLLGPSLFER